jgi:uncharacterized membrane protein
MIRRDALSEYTRGSLWVLPTAAALLALVAGSLLSMVPLGVDSPLAFQGTADDARSLLIGITSTIITVIALLLGLSVVALQLSSTQFSPRLLRNFLRDRPNQIVLSAFVATFAYSAAGLYTVGVSGGNRTGEFPRLAVSGALVLMFVSLGLLVFFADHLAHSIQIDAITGVVERGTLQLIREGLLPGEDKAPAVPAGAVVVTARSSGYLQAVHPEKLLPTARRRGVCVRLRPKIGEHVVAGTPIAWVWPATGGGTADPQGIRAAVEDAVRIGFERTLEQDPAFGVRQLVDVACKALSPGINDPYTAIQAIDHLTVIFARLAEIPLGDHVSGDRDGVIVVVPGWRFHQYLAVTCGLVRRYGGGEPTVGQALLRLLWTCAETTRPDPRRLAAIEEEAQKVVTAAEAIVAEPADLVVVRTAADAVRQALAQRRGEGVPAPANKA